MLLSEILTGHWPWFLGVGVVLASCALIWLFMTLLIDYLMAESEGEWVAAMNAAHDHAAEHAGEPS